MYEIDHLQGNAFWDFLFSSNPQDQLRRKFLSRIVALFRNRCFFTDKELFEQYEMKYKAHLDVEKLNQLFGTNEPLAHNIFRKCSGVFCVDNSDRICYSTPSTDMYDPTNFVDVFADENEKLRCLASEIAILGDRIFVCVKKFGLVKANRLIEMLELSMDVKLFSGFLLLYFSNTFNVEYQKVFSGNIVIGTRNNQVWPSEQVNRIERILIASTPKYPSLLECDPGNVFADVIVANCSVPSDGIFVIFCRLQAQRLFIREELRHLYERHTSVLDYQPLKAAPLRLNHPCLLLHGDALHRALITGQTGDGRVKVQCVDVDLIEFVAPNRLFRIPECLIGVPVCGVYGVLAFPSDNIVFPMHSPEMKQIWKTTYQHIRLSCVTAKLFTVANNCDYSGFRKRAVYKMQLRVVNAEDRWLLPDIWKTAAQ